MSLSPDVFLPHFSGETLAAPGLRQALALVRDILKFWEPVWFVCWEFE